MPLYGVRLWCVGWMTISSLPGRSEVKDNSIHQLSLSYYAFWFFATPGQNDQGKCGRALIDENKTAVKSFPRVTPARTFASVITEATPSGTKKTRVGKQASLENSPPQSPLKALSFNVRSMKNKFLEFVALLALERSEVLIQDSMTILGYYSSPI